MKRSATFSHPISRLYRYSLMREWSELRRVVFVMLNPSTADEATDDPTIRRCISFAKKWNYGGIEVVNLFAYCASDPKLLAGIVDPIGRDNNEYIVQAINEAGLVVAAWGAHRSAVTRGAEVKAILKLHAGEILRCLGKTKSGAPRHPLYVSSDKALERF